MGVQPAVESRNPPARKRRIVRTVATVGGGVCLLAVLLLLALHAGPTRRFVLNQLVAFLASRQIELQAEDVRYNLLRLSIEVRDLRLRSTELPNLPAFATVRRAHLDLAPDTILRGQIVVESATADFVDVHYAVDANGRSNLPRPAAEPGKTRQPLGYLVARLSVPNARVRYTNAAQHVDVSVPLSSVDMTGDALTARHRLRFLSTGGEAHIRGRAAAIDRLTGVLDLGADDLRIDRLRLEAIGSVAEISGSVHTFDAPELGLTLRASIDAGALLDRRDVVTGMIDVDATVSGPLSTPAIDARMSGSEMRLRSLGAARVELHGAYDPAIRRAEVSSVRLQGPWGRVAASGHLSLDQARSSRLHAEVTGVDAAAVVPDLRRQYIANATVDGTLDAEWPGLDYLEAAGAADVSFTGTADSPATGAVPLSGRLRFELGHGHRLKGELHASAADVGPEIGGAALIDARVGGTLEKPAVYAILAAPSLSMGAAVHGTIALAGARQLDLMFDASATDLPALARAANRPDVPVTGAVTAHGTIGGTVARPLASVAVRAADINVFGEPLGSLNADLELAGRKVTITASAERFNVDAKGVVGIARPWPADMSVRVNDVDVETLPLRQQTPLAGRLRGTLNATGDLADPGGIRATASIDPITGSWNGHAFTATSAGELRYEHARLDIGRLQLTVGDSTLIASGQVPLTPDAAGGELAIEAHANLATLAPLLSSDTRMAADGALTLAGSLRGTLQSITPDLVVTVENGVLLSPVFDPGVSHLQLRARIAEGAAEIEQLTSSWGSARIDASGTIPLELLPPLPIEIPRRDGPATIKASLHDLNPAAIPGAPAGVSGRVSVDVDASTARGDLTSLEGHIAFRELEVALNRLTLTQQTPSNVRIRSGEATVERVALSGSAGTVEAAGTIGLTGNRALDLKLDGTFDVSALSALSKSVRTEGTATWKLAASGSMTAPELNGTLDLADAMIASDELDVTAANVNTHIVMAGSSIELTRLSGELNGGTFDGSGRVTLANRDIADADLQFSATDFVYDAPLDLRSLSDASIRVTRRADEFLVAGQVTVTEAGLTADINFDEELFAAIKAPRTLDLTEGRHPLLERVRLNIDVDTATPVIVENNLARGEIDADLRVVGTPYEPGVTGSLTLAEGSQLMLNARRYQVERGVITFIDERRIAPSFDLSLHTEASDYDVRIAVTGLLGETETAWTSEPALPEPDIMALVVTGRTLDEMRGEESEVARAQALSYLTGRVGSKVGGGLERATGISEVRIDPVLIANETDPTARLTVGQNLTDQTKLIYSTNLSDSNDQIWVVEHDVTRRFQMRAVREREDDTYRGDFRHDVRFGGDPSPRRQTHRRSTIATLTVTADGDIDESEVRKRFKLETGDTYDYFAARSGLERIEQLYLESGYLQSRVRLERRMEDDTAHLALDVRSGPRIHLQFENVTPPSDVREEVRTAWHDGVFDRQRSNDSIEVLRQWLFDDNHLQANVEYELVDRAGERHVVFRIQPGPRYDRVVLAFEGASGIGSDRLNEIVEQQRVERQLFTDPTVVTTLLQRYYREQGFLATEIASPRYEFEGTTARAIVVIQEGPHFRVRQVAITGNTVYAADAIAKELPVVSGTPFLPTNAEHALERIRDLYWRKGYNDVRSEYALTVDRDAGAVDVAFTVVEGRQSVIAEIGVEGNSRTSERLVRGQMELSPDQPLDLAVLARSRRNLYGTGAFSIADITREDLDGDRVDDQKPVRVNVSVREVEPVQLRYGLSYDTDGGLGGILDLSIHNWLGKARVVGAQGRYDSEVRDARIYVSQPSLRFSPRKTIASVYYREDLNPPTEQTDPFDISRKGAAIQQDVQFRKSYAWSYGYRYELATTLEPSLGAGATETVRVSPLSSTLTRETRDEALDASTGSFVSQSFAYSPAWLGSDRPYLKYYGQYFRYFPLRPARRKPFSDEILRPRLVFATGVRVGLAQGLGGDVPTSERFYAGGSTTLRGFEQNAVGPIAENDVPAGGNVVLVLNNELRLPLFNIFDGVLFLDVGNVFPAISDFTFRDLRESAGVGLRLRTRWLLLRGDYGFVLDPRDGERRSRFYFNIGQAF